VIDPSSSKKRIPAYSVARKSVVAADTEYETDETVGTWYAGAVLATQPVVAAVGATVQRPSALSIATKVDVAIFETLPDVNVV